MEVLFNKRALSVPTHEKGHVSDFQNKQNNTFFFTTLCCQVALGSPSTFTFTENKTQVKWMSAHKNTNFTMCLAP